MAENLWPADTADRVMDDRLRNLVDECKRQEESCLYMSTALFEWLKGLRWWRGCFVVAPIILGALATWPLLAQDHDLEWLTGTCALIAGVVPAIYKALDLDVSLDAISSHAHTFKILQDRFRQAWRVSALGAPEEFKNEFDDLMARMDMARSASLAIPARIFKKAQAKIDAGHYDFAVDKGHSERPGTGR